ncbi:MAG: hypothetical protein ACX936_10820 [Marinobacter sp.]
MNADGIKEAIFRIGSALTLAAVAISIVGCDGSSDSDQPSSSSDDWPTANLPAQAALTVDDTQFLPQSMMREWHVQLDNLGVRPTGSEAHEAYTDELYKRLQKAGVENLYFEELEIDKWTPESWSLSIADGTEQLPASYIPSSGSTPSGGIEAELEYLTPETLGAIFQGKVSAETLFAQFNGKIVLVDFVVPARTASDFTENAFDVYDPENVIQDDTPYERMFTGTQVVLEILETLKSIGSAGVVFIVNEAGDATLTKHYSPYHGRVYDVPGLYVDRQVGAQLRNEAAVDNSINLELIASIEPAVTRNLIGIIPGASEELILLNSHTDGSNATEDNGPNAIVDMAQYLTRLPQDSMERGIMIMLSTGHFYSGVGIKDFLKRERDDGLIDRIAAVISIEHMGLLEYLYEDGGLVASGMNEPGTLYMPDQAPLIKAGQNWASNSDSAPTFLNPPTNPDGDSSYRNAVWPGEGQYFWGIAGIPTINYITGPAYLLKYDIVTVDFVDFDLMHRQTVAFTQMALDLMGVPREELPNRF